MSDKAFRVLAVSVFILGSLMTGHSGLVLAAGDADVALHLQGAHLVDLNKADADSLQAVKGIGPALAERIVAYREANGPFETVDDLAEVRGIGQVKLNKIKNQVIV